MRHLLHHSALLTLLAAAGCAPTARTASAPPPIAPATQPSAGFALDAAGIHPMYQHLLAIDLPTVMRVATAQNLDIQQARQRVASSQGEYESSVEAVFPVIAPSLAWTHFDGKNQNASGQLVNAAFNNFLPAVSIQWILNPGKVVYDIIASRRRLDASQDQESATLIETARRGASQYYDLVLAQARLAVARESLAEGEELERITAARLRAGTGLQADEYRAQTDLARRQQELLSALQAFYQASVALALTLQLDPSVTLVPSASQLQQVSLVRDDLSIDALLDIAVQYRPDLRASRELADALQADKNAVIWGGLGPQLQAGYGVGGISTDNSGSYSSLHGQQHANLNAGFQLGLSTFGQAKVGSAREQFGLLEAQRLADQIRAAVVSAHQASLTQAAIIPLARQQVASAEEALRLAQANLQAGTQLTIDVLQAQDALQAARLQFIDAVVHYNQAQLNLRATLGLLDGSVEAVLPATQPAGPVPPSRPQ